MTKALVLTTVLSLALAPLGWAHGEKHDEKAQGHSHEMAELHGGEVTMTPKHHFEVVFTPEEVRLYGYDAKQKPLNDLKSAKVAVSLQTRKGDAKELTLTYVAPDSKAGRTQGYFTAAYPFEKVEEGGMKAAFTVSGVDEKPVAFKTAVEVTELAMYACPMHADITGEDPVSCSKCGMTLAKQSHEGNDTMDMDHGKMKMDHDKKGDGHDDGGHDR